MPNLFSKCVCPLLNCFLFHIISCHGDLISRIIWISLYLLIWEHFIFFIVFLSIFKTNNHLICVSADYVCPSIEVGSCVGETNQWETIINLPSTISRICGWHSTPARNTHHIQTSFFLFLFASPLSFFAVIPPSYSAPLAGGGSQLKSSLFYTHPCTILDTLHFQTGKGQGWEEGEERMEEKDDEGKKKKRKSGSGLQIAYYFFLFLIIYAILSIYV